MSTTPEKFKFQVNFPTILVTLPAEPQGHERLAVHRLALHVSDICWADLRLDSGAEHVRRALLAWRGRAALDQPSPFPVLTLPGRVPALVLTVSDLVNCFAYPGEVDGHLRVDDVAEHVRIALRAINHLCLSCSLIFVYKYTW